jgi:hypothetical protein
MLLMADLLYRQGVFSSEFEPFATLARREFITLIARAATGRSQLADIKADFCRNDQNGPVRILSYGFRVIDSRV